MIYARDANGKFFIQADEDGDLWLPEWPVMMVDWPCAAAYALWLAGKTGLPWRLPGELEWEKAARGVDGRYYPWGHQDHAGWFNCSDSKERAQPDDVDSFPIDVSVYGVRGMAGNVRDWTASTGRLGPRLDGQRVLPPQPPHPDAVPEGARFVGRGGAWCATPGSCSAVKRVPDWWLYRNYGVGFRLARSV